MSNKTGLVAKQGLFAYIIFILANYYFTFILSKIGFTNKNRPQVKVKFLKIYKLSYISVDGYFEDCIKKS